MYIFSYDKARHNLQIKIKDVVYNFDSASEPKISPDKNSVALITPYEWECKGEVKVIDLNSGLFIDLTLDLDENSTPKYLIWKDPNTIYILIGFNWGTVAVGGDLYSLSINDNEIKLLKKFKEDIQITEMEFVDKDTLNLIGIRYIDDNFNNHEQYSAKLEL